MSKQLHKNFTDGQIKSFLKSYVDKKIKINYVLSTSFITCFLIDSGGRKLPSKGLGLIYYFSVRGKTIQEAFYLSSA